MKLTSQQKRLPFLFILTFCFFIAQSALCSDVATLQQYEQLRAKVDGSGRLQLPATANKSLCSGAKVGALGLPLILTSRLIPLPILEEYAPHENRIIRPINYSIKLSGFALLFLGRQKRNRVLSAEEEKLRAQLAITSSFYHTDNKNDTLDQYVMHIRQGLRVDSKLHKSGFFKTPFLLNDVPIHLHSGDAKIALKEAKRLRCSAVNEFSRSFRFRRAYSITLISSIAATSAISFYRRRNDISHDHALIRIGIPVTFSVYASSIPMRIGAERNFRKGLGSLHRELRKRYPLVQ